MTLEERGAQIAHIVLGDISVKEQGQYRECRLIGLSGKPYEFTLDTLQPESPQLQHLQRIIITELRGFIAKLEELNPPAS
jgi:hypothetical protein